MELTANLKKETNEYLNREASPIIAIERSGRLE
jgi:hypothetical protein